MKDRILYRNEWYSVVEYHVNHVMLKDEIGNGKRQWLLFEYQSFIKSKINKPKAQIGFAKT